MAADDHRLKGTGGGFGNYQGLSLEEISERFAQCEADPSMRSVSALLRITREQIMARGQLSVYPKLSAAFAILAAICFVATPFLPPDLKASAPKASLGLLVLSAILAYGALTSRLHRQASVAQEREIYRLAAESLQRVLAFPFPRKELTREQIDTLKDLVKRNPDATSLRVFLTEAIR